MAGEEHNLAGSEWPKKVGPIGPRDLEQLVAFLVIGILIFKGVFVFTIQFILKNAL
jgi:hypothetical protein